MPSDTPSEGYYIGVDVGTGSARAGLFDRSGTCVASARESIAIFREGAVIAEQSSDDIWRAVRACVGELIATTDIDPDRVRGIGFDATCSLVVLDGKGQPLTVSRSGNDARNIIVWMDQRATDQAARINDTGHRVLQYVGNRISPEMQTPKLLWLKENLPETYRNAGHFFDLVDFLTWRASGDPSRSVCTVTCKWTYMAHERSWDPGYFRAVGLEGLTEQAYARIGRDIVDAGSPLGDGLTADAAGELGLSAGTAVGAGLIDAHAGGVGTVGASGPYPDACSRMAYVFGTSACTMSSSTEEAFVPGVWGPYYSAMVPGLWLTEGGQSAAGEAIAHLLSMHPANGEATELARAAGLSLPDYLLSRISGSAAGAVNLAGRMIVVPDFLGNRAPFADPDARAIIAGLDLDSSVDSLVGLYVAGVTGLGYGLRQIIDAQARHGVAPKVAVISGGAGENRIVKQLLADSANIPFADPATPEPVLLGSAMLGAVASGDFDNLTDAMTQMSRLGSIFNPAGGEVGQRHESRYQTFAALQQAARDLS